MFCNNCGKKVNEQEKFCRYCGATITNSNAESNMSFDIILTNAGTNRIKVINVITETTGMSLKEAKEIVDNAPKTLKHNVTKETAEDIKAKLAEVGADIELQHSIKTSNSTESQAEVKTEQKPNKKQSKKKMWQTAFTINFTVVVMAIIVALAMMDSDDNENIKNTTVATSTNPVETKNEVTKQNYIANSEKKTNEEKSQQNTVNNNNFEKEEITVMSNNIYGMRFNKTISEFCEDYNKALEDTYKKLGEDTTAIELYTLKEADFSYTTTDSVKQLEVYTTTKIGYMVALFKEKDSDYIVMASIGYDTKQVANASKFRDFIVLKVVLPVGMALTNLSYTEVWDNFQDVTFNNNIAYYCKKDNTFEYYYINAMSKETYDNTLLSQ